MELSVTMETMVERAETPFPYPSSWIDRLTERIDRLSGSAWLYYLTAASVVIIGQLLIGWWEGCDLRAIAGFATVLTGSSIYYLALIHYLDRSAAHAVAAFRPMMSTSDEKVSELTYRLTTMPASIVRILTLIGILSAASMIVGVERGVISADQNFFGASPLAHAYWRAALIADQIMFWNLIYHTIHQLRVVSLIYSEHTKIDLFNLSPLYTFSRHSARTAVGMVFITYLWVTSFPWLSGDFLVIGSWLLGNLTAVAGFLLPLIGIHRRLVTEKQRLKAEAGQWLKTSIAAFHHHLGERQYEQVDPLVKAMEGIAKEQEILERIPTWPWQPGTVRGLATTILAPVVLWLILGMLERIVSF